MHRAGFGEPQVPRRVILGAAVGGAAATAVPGLAAGPAAAVPPGTVDAAAAPIPLDNRMTTDTQWANFLRGQDLLWRRLPTIWYDGPFLGDGRLGSMIYKEPNQNRVRFFAPSESLSFTSRPGLSPIRWAMLARTEKLPGWFQLRPNP